MSPRSPRRVYTRSLRVPEHQNHGVPAQEELADEAVLVDGLRLLLASVRDLRPHLPDILQHHVGVAVECFDASEDLPVVPAIYQDLGIVLHALLQHRQGSYVKVVLLLLLLLLSFSSSSPLVAVSCLFFAFA